MLGKVTINARSPIRAAGARILPDIWWPGSIQTKKNNDLIKKAVKNKENY